MKKSRSRSLAVVFGLLFVAWGMTRWERAMVFDAECGVHVLNAARTDNPAIAAQELDKAIQYLQRNNLTEGSTAWFASAARPDENLGIWYKNLQWHRKFVGSIAPDAAEQIRTDAIATVRQDLVRHAENGDEINAPYGISVYPYGGRFAGWGVASLVLALLFGFASMRELEHSPTEEEEELLLCARH